MQQTGNVPEKNWNTLATCKYNIQTHDFLFSVLRVLNVSALKHSKDQEEESLSVAFCS